MAFKDLTEEQKQERYAYNRERRKRLKEAAEGDGGYVPPGGGRERLSDEERLERRQFHHMRRRKTMQAAYQQLRDMGLSPAEADEELADIQSQIGFFPNQGAV